jgi:creatinine amidohydrolase
MPSVYLEHLTWVESEQALARIPTVLLPIGAASKEHGPHLPNNTDWLVVNELARRVAVEVEVIVAPTLGFGYYNAFVEFPGTIHLAAGTFRDVVLQTAASLHRNGARRFFILNNGLSTAFPLNIAAADLVERHRIPTVVCHVGQLARARVRALIERPIGSHANELETSLVLAVAPDRVRMELAAPDIQPWMHAPDAIADRSPLTRDPGALGKFCPSGVIGDPTLATAEKGEAVIQAYVAEIAAYLRSW